MLRTYFILNGLLYVLFALWCTVKSADTAKAIGYVERSASGQSEYLVVYGGLQVGLGLFFLFLATKPELFRAGAIFSLLLYTPIVIYRLVTIAKHWPVSNVTLATGGLELLLLVGAMGVVAKS